jgi:hypothetical protein
MLLARQLVRMLRQALLGLLALAFGVGLAYGLWSLRPVPDYSSAELTAGSPFDVAFRVENGSAWFSMSNVRVTCVVDHVRASGMPPAAVVADALRFPAGSGATLLPGESASFRCPFRALIGHPINEDPDIAQRAEIYFHARYDLPFLSLPLTDNSAHFFFNTQVLPPRWTVVRE